MTALPDEDNNTMQCKTAKENGLSFLCFGGLDWWYQHRSHVDFQLSRRFAKLGPAIYVNSIVMQKPNLAEGRKFFTRLVRKAKSIFTGLKPTDAGFWVYSPFSMPVHHIGWARSLNRSSVRWQVERVARKLGLRDPVIMVVCPAACDMALSMKHSRLVYLRTDVYELFPNVEYEIVKDYDRRLKSEADLTVFVSCRLFEEEADQCTRPLYLDHGVDYEQFASADADHSVPTDIAQIEHPIIGYFGTIDGHTVDISLVESLADHLADMSIVLVGKIASPCDSLAARPNVWLLGQKPYEQVPHYGKCFDVAIMPWRQTDWIRACNPIKLKEYLALGKPVVSTPFAELDKYPGVVYRAVGADEFALTVRQALEQDSPEKIQARRTRVAHSSWESKVETILRELFENVQAAQDIAR